LLFILGILECRFGEELVGVEEWKSERLRN